MTIVLFFSCRMSLLKCALAAAGAVSSVSSLLQPSHLRGVAPTSLITCFQIALSAQPMIPSSALLGYGGGHNDGERLRKKRKKKLLCADDAPSHRDSGGKWVKQNKNVSYPFNSQGNIWTLLGWRECNKSCYSSKPTDIEAKPAADMNDVGSF